MQTCTLLGKTDTIQTIGGGDLAEPVHAAWAYGLLSKNTR